MLPYIVFYLMFGALCVAANMHFLIVSVPDIVLYTSLASLITLWVTGKYRPRFKPLHESWRMALASGFILGAIFALLLVLNYFLLSLARDAEGPAYRLLYLTFKGFFLDSLVVASFTSAVHIFLYGQVSIQGRPTPKTKR